VNYVLASSVAEDYDILTDRAQWNKPMADDDPQDYDVKVYATGEMDEESLAACVTIIKAGDAVDPESAANDLRKQSGWRA